MLRLKKIQLYHFKSFSPATTLECPGGIVTIVGPNGSGKSNLVDALLWALGHQSARDLRSERMEDVIFSGSNTYPPASMTEVVLTFTNADESESWTISRRLFRNKISEYFLNGKHVRLQDVQEFCNEHQIFTHPYAIILQGQINTICEMRPQEMRVFVDNIAGISVYKRKRETIEKRIEKTLDNIQRIIDILHELQYQWDQKKHQAERTQLYLELTHQIDTLRFRKKAVEIKKLWKKKQKLASRQHDLRMKLDPIEREWLLHKEKKELKWEDIAKIQETIEKRRHDLQQADYEITSLRKKLHTFIEDLHRKEKKLSLLQERFLRFQEEKERLLLEKNQLSHECAQLEKTLDMLQNEHIDLETQWAEFQERESQFMETYEKTKLKKSTIEQKNHDLHERYVYWNELKKNFEHELNLMDEKLEQYRNEKHALSKEKKRISALLETYVTESEKLAEQKEAYKSEIEHIEHELKNVQHELAVLEDVMKRMKEEKTHIKNQLLHLSSTERNLSRILSSHFLFKEITHDAFRIGDEREVIEALTEDELRCCVPFFQDWILLNPEKLPHLVKLLLETNYPPCRIWKAEPLLRKAQTSVRDRTTLMKVFLEWVCEKEGSLEGDTQVFTFGDFWMFSGKEVQLATQRMLQLRQEYTLLEARERTLKEKMATLRKDLENLEKVLPEKVKKYETFVKELQEIEEKKKPLVQAYENIAREETELDKKLLQIESQKNELRRTYERALEQIENIATEMSVLEKEKISIEQILQAYESEKESYDRDKHTFESRRLTLQRKLGQARERLGVTKKRLTELEKQLDFLQTNMNETENEKKQLEATIREKQTIIQNEEHRIQNIEHRAAQMKEELLKLEEQSENEMRAIQVLEKHLSDIQKQRTELLDTLRRYELEELQIESRWEEATSDIKQEQEDITLDNILSMKIQFTQKDEKRLRELEEKRMQMGPVNLMALEEFKTLTARKQHLEKQKEDLMHAIRSLKDAIRKIDGQMIELLKDTTYQLNTNLNRYLQVFFDGGSGELLWLNEADLLNSGLLLRVKLPGKRIRTMLQLSGGEKTMVSLALLLAAHDIRPGSILILDEVDAPLDDANVDRLMHVIQHYPHDTQFIFITHNKRTIQYADAIYGVVQKDGVSRIFSMRLEETEKVLA